MDIVKKIEANYKDSPDLISREIKLNLFFKINIIFLESLCSSDKINDYLYRNIHKKTTNLNNLIGAPKTLKITSKEINYYLNNGYTLVIHKNDIYALETKANIIRSVTTPETQMSINGPKDAFVESYQVNLGLIRRRIKSPQLAIKEYRLGKSTKNLTGVIYMNNIADKETINRLCHIIETIDIDGIIDSSYIANYIEKYEKQSFIPNSFKTERPDYVVNALLDGKVAVICDNSPFVLVVPVFIIDFINPPLDNYSEPKGINHLKLLRIICFIITLTLPAIYIALTNYNQESIPTNLLISFAKERQGVPFSSIIEALIMLFTYEMLRESDIRFPSNYGSAISILGALILGEASVTAGIVSPIMIIIIAITFISSLIFTDIDFINSIRHYRYLFLISAGFFGLFGIMLTTIYFLGRLNSRTSLHKPTSLPSAPLDKHYLFKSVFQVPLYKQFFRSKNLSKKNIVKQR